jgi:hypothetical protein
LSDRTSARETLESDVLEFLYARLNSVWRPETRSLDSVTRFLERLVTKPADFAHLAIIYHLFRSGGAERFFVNELPEAVHRLSHSTRRARNVGRKVGRGQIVWSETVVRQHSRSDPTVYVVNQAVKEYDTPVNRLLAHYLREVWAELSRIKASSRGRLTTRAEAIVSNSQDALRSAYLREARSITAVDSSMLHAAGRSKHVIYWRAAELWEEFERLQNTKDIARLREILLVGWIGPLDDDALFELYVLIRSLRALEKMLCDDRPEQAVYNLITGGGDWIAQFTGTEWTATVHFNTAPHNAFENAIREGDYKYKNLLARYEGTAAARRPDICVALTRRSDGFLLPILIEVKNVSLSSQYGRDSIYKVFGYLADFEKLWSGDRADIHPRAALVLREQVAANDQAAALLEEVVLVSPPNLIERLEEVFRAAIESANTA